MSLALSGCFDEPKDFYGPSWDVEMNVPLTEKTYTLQDAIENDTSVVKWYQNTGDADKDGQLYYSDQTRFERITVDDNLNIDGFNTRFSRKVGNVTINDVDLINTGIDVNEWSNVEAGELRVFPESTGELDIAFQRIEAFNSVTLESGVMVIDVLNRLPVPIELQGLQIVNARSGTIVAERSQTIAIDSFATETLNFDLTGQIQDSLKYVGTIYSPGSDGNVVEVPNEAGTEVTASFENLVIERVVAALPAQDPITLDSTFAIDDSTQIEEANIQQGSFNLTFNNYMDVTVDATLTINSLKRDDGSTYSRDITLQRNERDKVVEVPDMEGWAIDPQGGLTNELNYFVEVNTRETQEPRTIAKNDSLTAQINFQQIFFQDVKGKIKPTSFQMETTSFGFDLGEFENNFNYTDINIDNPNILLRLFSSAEVGFNIEGTLEGSNGSQQESIQLNINIPGDNNQTVVDLSDFGLKQMINSFSNQLPDTFDIRGNTVVNPQFNVGSVSRNDSVSGNVDIEIPLNIGIEGGAFKDTFDVDLGEDRQDILDAIDSTDGNGGKLLEAMLTIELTNKIPADISVTGAVLDTLTNDQIVQLPPPYNEITEIVVDPPEVDDQGNVTAASETAQDISFQGEDAVKFVRNPRLMLNVLIETASFNDQTNPVKFRITDEISVRVFGTVNYTVDSESN